MVFAGCVVKEQTGELTTVALGHHDLNWVLHCDILCSTGSSNYIF